MEGIYLFLQVFIEFRCRIEGVVQMRFKNEYRSFNDSDIESIREAIQKFLDGKPDKQHPPEHFNQGVSSISKGIHAVEINLTGEIKKVFEQLFDTENWKEPFKEIKI